jgi:hypothetical protein
MAGGGRAAVGTAERAALVIAIARQLDNRSVDRPSQTSFRAVSVDWGFAWQ